MSKHLTHTEKMRFNGGNVGEKNIVPSKDENLFVGPCAVRDATHPVAPIVPLRVAPGNSQIISARQLSPIASNEAKKDEPKK